MLTVKDKNGTISRTYDALNRVNTYTDYRGNTISYSYDELGNLITLTYPGGKIVRYEHDSNGSISSVIDWEGRTTSYEYNKNGQISKQIRPDGSIETYEYDKNGRLTSKVDTLGDTILQEDSYSYDQQGNIEKISTYQQDSAEQLQTVTMIYNEVNQLVTYNGISVTYDKNGNMTYGPLDGEMVDFSYDCRNRLIKAGTTTYEYDAENQRITVNEEKTRYEYVVNSNAELSQILSTTEYAKDKNGDYKTQGEITYFIYGNGLVAQTDDNNGYLLYHYDHLGSTTLLTNDIGEVVNRFAYGPYGELLSENPLKIQFLYNGSYGVVTDSNSLYYMRARYYNPEIKRFINQDVIVGTISNSASLNRYSYVQGNPISLLDPFGLSPWSFFSKVAHSVLGILGFIPGIGDVFDLVNAGLYLMEGNYRDAGISLLCALPALGSFAGNSIKLAFKGNAKVCKAVDLTVKSIKLGSRAYFGVVAGGNATVAAYNMVTKIQKGEDITFSDVASFSVNVFCSAISLRGIGKDFRTSKKAQNIVSDFSSAKAQQYGDVGSGCNTSNKMLDTNAQCFKGGSKAGKNVFPDNPDNLLPEIPRDKVTKSNGGTSQKIPTSDNVIIRAETHPLEPGETYNPRHHGQHYHVEYKIDPNKSWNNKSNVKKVYPPGYTNGSGTGFLPGEEFPQ